MKNEFFSSLPYSVTLEDNGRLTLFVSYKRQDERPIQKAIVTLLIDPMDNRITIENIHDIDALDDNATGYLVNYLDAHFGGKQIFILPNALQNKFKEHGFTNDPAKQPIIHRVCASTFNEFKNIAIPENIAALYITHSFITNADVEPKMREDVFQDLARNSGFLKTKIEQYSNQNFLGFRLMCQYSRVFALCDLKTNEIVAFCRITSLSNGNFYLSDTLVNPEYFEGNKALGTALLYKRVADCFPLENRVLLISPPDRAEEFKTYGCQSIAAENQNIYIKFSSAKPGFEEIFKNACTQLLTSSRQEYR